MTALPPIDFTKDNDQLTPDGHATVAQAAALLKTAPNLRLRINGYTDDLGDWEINLALSRGRAEAVRQVLITNGIPAAQVTAVGWSEDYPKVPNTSADSRAINRRVEIVIG